MSRIFLWRHSRTAYNAEGRLQGSLDIPLGENGVAQAAAAARTLVRHYGSDMRVVSSPLQRAMQSAQELASLVSAPVEPHEGLTQRPYGEWEGLTWAEVQERWPEQYETRMSGGDPDIAGWGESDAVGQRVAAALDELADAAATTVAVSHGSAIHLGLLTLIGQPSRSRVLGKLPHGAWHVVRRVDSGAWHIEAFGVGAD